MRMREPEGCLGERQRRASYLRSYGCRRRRKHRGAEQIR